ncbi:unnamed protein product [Caenorhabditis sp. 36 PRJEB53466]|nr:unnamed protein product [Caenorhabditis sp. 36 PRJEB53466]
MVSTDTDDNLELLSSSNNHSVNWKIRPQNIGFMYYLRTLDDGHDLGVRGIVKWKVQLKNWSPNDTTLEGFLVTIMDHDTNETVDSYELTMTEPFEHFAEHNEVLEMRLEMDNVLGFDRRYDAKINILPIGKQAPASSFISIMGKLEGEKCSTMTGLAERWAPHVMVDVFDATAEVELSWKPAPSFLCIKTYEVVLQNREGFILNITEVDVTPGQLLANTSFRQLARDQMMHVKVRGKNSIDGGCACVNCNCITDKSKYFTIPTITRTTTITPTTKYAIHKSSEPFSILHIFLCLTALGVVFAILIIGCLCCKKYNKVIWKQKVAFNALKTSQFPNKKIREEKIFKIMLVCPELTGREHDYMMRIAEAMRNSSNTVVCDRWKEHSEEAEENMLHWVYQQTQIAEKIVMFHSNAYQPRCGVYDVINNFFPCTDPRLAHITLSPCSQQNVPREVEFVMPRDQKLLEEAYGITIADPLIIDIPGDCPVLVPISPQEIGVAENSVHISPDCKTHSTDSGVSSMSSNSSDSGGITDSLPSDMESQLKDLNIESHPLLRQPIPV